MSNRGASGSTVESSSRQVGVVEVVKAEVGKLRGHRIGRGRGRVEKKRWAVDEPVGSGAGRLDRLQRDDSPTRRLDDQPLTTRRPDDSTTCLDELNLSIRRLD
jgi:hypothetical protein